MAQMRQELEALISQLNATPEPEVTKPVRDGSGFPAFKLLAVIVIIGLSVSHFLTSRELTHVKSELNALRNDLSVLDAADDNHIYAIALPTEGKLKWRWRIQLPKSGTYRLSYMFDNIPDSGLPPGALHDNLIFSDSAGASIPGGEPFIFSLEMFRYANGEWEVNSESSVRSTTQLLQPVPEWLKDSKGENIDVKIAGTGRTISSGESGDLVLVKYRNKEKQKAKAQDLETEVLPPTGMMFWIERFNKS